MTPKQTTLIISAAIATLTCGTSSAEAQGHLYGIEAETVSTSSDFDRNTINFNYGSKQGEAGFGGSAAHHRIDDKDASFRANEVKLRAGHQLNDTFFVEGGIGAANIDSQHDNRSEDLVTYQAGARAKLSDQLSAGISHEKDFAYREQILTNQAGKILNAKTTRADVKYRPAERIRIEAAAGHQSISDGNSSREYQIGAYYGISPSWPWIWAGVEYSNLDFKYQDEGYWTPNNHRSVAGTLSASFPVNDSINMNSSLSINRNKDDDSDDSGTGYYASVGADMKLSPNSTVSANAHYIKSRQDNSDWDETGANVGFTFNHF
ncbi:MAG: hypothetical protein R3F02_15885 [Thiolinea sp.]